MSPDNRFLYTGSHDAMVRKWSIETGRHGPNPNPNPDPNPDPNPNPNPNWSIETALALLEAFLEPSALSSSWPG